MTSFFTLSRTEVNGRQMINASLGSAKIVFAAIVPADEAATEAGFELIRAWAADIPFIPGAGVDFRTVEEFLDHYQNLLHIDKTSLYKPKFRFF